MEITGKKISGQNKLVKLIYMIW